MKHKKLYLTLSIFLFISIGLYFYARIFYKASYSHMTLTQSATFSIAKRVLVNVIGMVVCATLIAMVTQVFQTLTQNRIITPSLIGFDSIFILSQSILVLFSKSSPVLNKIFSNSYLNFGVSTFMMIVISVSMVRLMLKNNRNNIYLLLLFGATLSTLVRSIANYVEVLLDPTSFQQLKAATSVTLTNMNSSIVLLVSPLMIWIVMMLINKRHELDVMLLKQDNATALGVPYLRRLNTYLILISLAMSITTALVGPLTFLGLIAVNIAKSLTQDYRHGSIFFVSSLVAMLMLIFGQTLVEFTRYATPVSVLIHFFGGIYMIYLMVKEVRL